MMKNYAKTYKNDKEKIIEIRDFLRKNCRGEIVEAKKSYCEAHTKQSETYTSRVKKYETCLNTIASGEVIKEKV
jgi:hypothetical protein